MELESIKEMTQNTSTIMPDSIKGKMEARNSKAKLRQGSANSSERVLITIYLLCFLSRTQASVLNAGNNI